MYQGAAFSDFVFVCLGREGASSARPSTLSSSHVPSAGLGAGGHPSFLNGRNVPNAGGALRSEESSSSLTEAQQREIRRKSLSSLAFLHGTIYFIHLLIVCATMPLTSPKLCASAPLSALCNGGGASGHK